MLRKHSRKGRKPQHQHSRKNSRKPSRKMYRGKSFVGGCGRPAFGGLIVKHYLAIMCETVDLRLELHGHIDESKDCLFVLRKDEAAGTATMAPQWCQKGAVASWHSHPPNTLLVLPDEDIFFQPPSEADIYNLILNRLNAQNDYAIVFSMEGAYVMWIEDQTLEQIKKEFLDAGVSMDMLQTCDYVLKPNFNETGFLGFEPDDQFPVLSHLLGARQHQTILREEKSFEAAFQRLETYYSELGVHITLVSTVQMPSLTEYRIWREARTKSNLSWEEWLKVNL